MGALYIVAMLCGAFGYRIPASGWKPEGWTPPAAQGANAMITHGHVHVKKVWGIPQFWLVWMVLTMNVSAGIGVIGMASPMLQEVFGGSLIGVAGKFSELDKTQLTAIAGVAAGFAALLSLFNIVGRFFWASLSDKLGRKMTYTLVLRARRHPVFQHPGQRGLGQQADVRGRFLHHPEHVRRRLRHGAGLSGRPVRHPDGGCDPRPPAHRLGHGRHHRPGGRELHAGIPVEPWHPPGAGVQPDHVHPGGHVDRGPDLQLVGAPGV